MMAQPTVVIVVDDDPGLLKSVARLLAHHGIESRTFPSAEALLESDSVQTATCLLLDIHLGEFRGSRCSAGLRHRDRRGRSSS
ncbi:response regulator [Bradyrhizobium sp. 155]|uniref:response regulator n=1 Tax=Bradyrhizobium sp. 155 TaxID=2782629 RepID=UPI001FFEDAFB|nr:response regulator [Bradyrhizobium sp. 155]